MNGAIMTRLEKHMQDNEDELQPGPVQVLLTEPFDPIADARSVYFAMQSIAMRYSLREALAMAKPTMNRGVVRDVYSRVFRSDDDAQTPSREAEREAEVWLIVR